MPLRKVQAFEADLLDVDAVVCSEDPKPEERGRVLIWLEVLDETWPLALNREDAAKLLELIPAAFATLDAADAGALDDDGYPSEDWT